VTRRVGAGGWVRARREASEGGRVAGEGELRGGRRRRRRTRSDEAVQPCGDSGAGAVRSRRATIGAGEGWLAAWRWPGGARRVGRSRSGAGGRGDQGRARGGLEDEEHRAGRGARRGWCGAGAGAGGALLCSRPSTEVREGEAASEQRRASRFVALALGGLTASPPRELLPSPPRASPRPIPLENVPAAPRPPRRLSAFARLLSTSSSRSTNPQRLPRPSSRAPPRRTSLPPHTPWLALPADGAGSSLRSLVAHAHLGCTAAASSLQHCSTACALRPPHAARRLALSSSRPLLLSPTLQPRPSHPPRQRLPLARLLPARRVLAGPRAGAPLGVGLWMDDLGMARAGAS